MTDNRIKLPLILDGATGTNLSDAGMPANICPEKWIIENPEPLEKLQSDFYDAGSRAVCAATFGANREKLSRFSLGDRVSEYNGKLVGISRGAFPALVAGDISQLGVFTLPMGEYRFEEIYDIYYEQAKALADADVDFFLVETTANLTDTRAALLAAKAVSDKPVFISFTCENGGKTFTGTDIRSALVVLESMGVDAFGLNCSAGPDMMLENIRLLTKYANVPLIAKPNAGIPEIIGEKTHFHLSPEEFASYASKFAQAGVAIFGGCCGTRPAHIEALSKALAGVSLRENRADISRLAATERELFPLGDITLPEAIEADDELADNISDSEDDMLLIRIGDSEGLELFEESTYLINRPLALVSDSSDLLESALRAFNGRALIEKSDKAEYFAAKYGAIII